MAKTTKRRTTSARKSSSRSKVVPSRSTRKPSAKKKTIQLKPISQEKKLDITGIVMILVGVLTLISLLSSQGGIVTSWWTNVLAKAMGLGKIILPLGLIFVGGWLLLRHTEKTPRLTGEFLLGILLLFFNGLTWLHVFTEGDLATASSGKGGGYIGAFIMKILTDTLGEPGMIIVLIAWLIISLVPIFDISISDMAKFVSDMVQKITEKVKQSNEARKKRLDDLKAKTELENANKARLATPVPQSYAPSVPPAQTQSAPQPVIKVTHSTGGTSKQTPPRQQWILPDPAQVLDRPSSIPIEDGKDQYLAQMIEESLKALDAPAHVIEIKRGPTITMFGVEPDLVQGRQGAKRVRVSKIASTADDLAMALQVSRIRIQAPVPGKGYVGIEVPNKEISLVSLYEIISSPIFQKNTAPLKFALGKDVSGNTKVTDMGSLPHLLIAGTTNSGKSVCINSILSCLLMTHTPDQLRLVLVDPKSVELVAYNSLPHMLTPVIVETPKVIQALQWLEREMDNRYQKFNKSGCRGIQEYNDWRIKRGEETIPYLLLVIDELADMMMNSPTETEKSIARLAQMARATGIHLILATQRPSTDIITGVIKANFPARIAFAVFSGVDSRVILDHLGAEKLVGKGDMLYQAPDASAPVRLQGTFVSDAEIGRLTSFWHMQGISEDAPTRPTETPAFTTAKSVDYLQKPLWQELEKDPDEDPMTNEAIAVIRQEGRASVSMLQRKFRIGYTRAARLVESLESRGIIGEPNPQTQVREVLDYGPVGPPAEDTRP